MFMLQPRLIKPPIIIIITIGDTYMGRQLIYSYLSVELGMQSSWRRSGRVPEVPQPHRANACRAKFDTPVDLCQICQINIEFGSHVWL